MVSFQDVAHGDKGQSLGTPGKYLSGIHIPDMLSIRNAKERCGYVRGSVCRLRVNKSVSQSLA